jgi:hypothetical protein
VGRDRPDDDGLGADRHDVEERGSASADLGERTRELRVDRLDIRDGAAAQTPNERASVAKSTGGSSRAAPTYRPSSGGSLLLLDPGVDAQVHGTGRGAHRRRGARERLRQRFEIGRTISGPSPCTSESWIPRNVAPRLKAT